VRTGPVAVGTGTVTSVSVTTANGVSGTVATATTTPAISLTLGAITPSSITGAAINNSVIGGVTPAAATVTTLTASGQILAEDGAKNAPAYSYSGHTPYGWYYRSGVQELSANGAAVIQVSAAALTIGNATPSLQFAPGDVTTTSPDTFLQRSAAGKVKLGSTSGGTEGTLIGSAVNVNQFQPLTLYSAAGTPLPAAAAGNKGYLAVVSDATAPTYNANYTSGGAVVALVISDGTNWKTI